MPLPKKVYVIVDDWTLWEHTTPRARAYHPTTCHIVGWLIHEDRGKIVLALEWMPNPYGDDIRHTIAIPRVCVESMFELRRASTLIGEKKTDKDYARKKITFEIEKALKEGFSKNELEELLGLKDEKD